MRTIVTALWNGEGGGGVELELGEEHPGTFDRALTRMFVGDVTLELGLAEQSGSVERSYAELLPEKEDKMRANESFAASKRFKRLRFLKLKSK
ncbi:hypothetical protein CDAR_259571 [Caerostris darwini]|uniref:Uncharacterized protein n=1 Tax=Caerostris darwini TaxID=1538125 RepID=A0AAV4VNP0_9ARAC|nr:hypothetical protein CDAR_259571 [Caerostris darwini]